MNSENRCNPNRCYALFYQKYRPEVWSQHLESGDPSAADQDAEI